MKRKMIMNVKYTAYLHLEVVSFIKFFFILMCVPRPSRSFLINKMVLA